MPDRLTSRWVPALVAAAAAALALAALAAHAWQSFSGGYLSYVSGIWLALGRDVADGVFFRDLIGPLGYGGTRYFPLFFILIGSFLAVGIPPLAAGWLASGVAGAVLATGLARIARALDAPRHVIWLAAAAAIAPYFVQQTLFEVRADVLAAGLNLWGLSAVVPLFCAQRAARTRAWPAVVWFTLALATKITSLTVPGCVAIALVLSGRRRSGFRFVAGMAAGSALFLAVVQTASGGRALTSWRACMFAGTGEGQTLQSLLAGEFIALARYSHLLTALLGLTCLALAAGLVLAWRERRQRLADGGRNELGGRALWLPVVLFAGVSSSTALTLSSPGTVPSNQMVEWLGVTFAVLLFAAAARRELTLVVSTVLALVVVWMSAQDFIRVSQLWQARATRTTVATRQQIVDLVADAPAPVLSESALWPVLAGQQPFLLDPFALRVVMMSRPDIARDLETRVDARAFPVVIFQVDPTSAKGRGYYENVNFGWPITDRILSHYRFESHPASDVWIYVPKGRDER
jgi:hypothetical protein